MVARCRGSLLFVVLSRCWLRLSFVAYDTVYVLVAIGVSIAILFVSFDLSVACVVGMFSVLFLVLMLSRFHD